MGEQEKKEGFLLPATVYKLKSFITIKDSKISEEHNDTDPALMLCQDQSGKHFIVKYSDYFVKDTQSINDLKTFFKLKSEQQVDKALTLKIKDQLEESDEFQDKLEEMIEEQELSRKDAKTFEKKYTLEQAEELAFNSWLNKPGSWIRTTLNETNETCNFEGKELPIYQSKSIQYKEDGKPSFSGMYYISRTRHSIPLKIYTSKHDDQKSTILVNNSVLTKDTLLTLLKHSYRTVKIKSGYHLNFTFDKINNLVLEKLLLELENKDLRKKTPDYLVKLTELITLVEEDDNIITDFKDISIFLPGAGAKVNLKQLVRTQSSLLYKWVEGLINIKHFYFKDNIEIIDDCLNILITELIDKRQSLYGFYGIVGADSDETESDTYGWLKDNIQDSKIIMDTNKNIEMYHLLHNHLTKLAEEKGLKK
jgi:hypothetical protein